MYAVADGAATGTDYTNYGIYAKAQNASINYAGYFDGDVMLNGSGAYGGVLKAVNDTGVETVQIKGGEFAGDGAELRLYEADGTNTFEVDAEMNSGAHVYLRNGDGTTTIQLDADYNGDGRIITQELQITGGSDLSEQFDVDPMEIEIEPGMVVSIDPENPGKLAVSKNPYDNKVAGIISGAGGIKPGMMMGQEGTKADGKHPVALTGRVYCWADAANGPIKPGDLVTTSAVAGHAMKVTDHNSALGAIIGKAMTSLDEGRGLILVLVSLQ
jgi:hypothetical protein